ncbi:hypothetical protein J6590_004317 [Homalodisca vitripennis]|nr:hypothetical protein J6590_004317 [Homalodisca vitripennis]
MECREWAEVTMSHSCTSLDKHSGWRYVWSVTAGAGVTAHSCFVVRGCCAHCLCYANATCGLRSELSGNASDSEFTVPPVPTMSEVNHNNNNTSQQQQMAQLQMLQMAGLPLPSAQAMAMAASKMDAKDQQQPSAEDMALLHQLYGLGLGFPQGFVQSAMLSATGKFQPSRELT